MVFTNEHLIYQMSLENSVEFSNVTVLDITEPEIKSINVLLLQHI